MSFEVVFTKNIDTEKASKEGLIKGILETGLNIKTEARTLAPVQTGQLRNSIDISDISTDLTLRVGSNLDYAASVEYGRRDGKGARPYMRPALEIVKGKSVEDTKQALNEAMK